MTTAPTSAPTPTPTPATAAASNTTSTAAPVTVSTTVPTPTPAPAAASNTTSTAAPVTGSVVNSSTVVTNTTTTQSPVAAANTQNTMTASIATRLQQNLSPSEFAILITDISQYGKQAQKTLISTMENYLINMALGKPISPTNGILYQYSLYNQILIILQNISTNDFIGAWSLLLRYYYQNNKGVLSAEKVNRFIYLWKQSSGNKDLFTCLNNLLQKTNDVNTMLAVVKTIPFNRLFNSGLNDTARTRLSVYYKIQS